MVQNPTVAAPPSTQDVASRLLSTMSALSGVLTDYNKGSQIRTIAESVGAASEQQSIWTTALSFQALMYCAMGVMGISPYPAFPSLGTVTFQTAPTSPPNSTVNVAIPSGTVVQTTGGVQFTTTQSVTLTSGTASVNAPVQSLLGGAVNNVPSASITQIVTGLLYPLFVTNSAATSGGTDAEQLSQTMARFAAALGAVPRSSPLAVANAAIGVVYSGTGEVVRYSTCYEPWIAAGSGAGSGTAGYTVYIDDGLGTASSGLVNAVTAVLRATNVAGATGYAPAGVPYSVVAVTGTPAVVGVSGVVSSLTTTGVVSGLIATAVSGYFALAFGQTAQQAILAQTVGNSVLGLMTSLTVSLYASGSSTAVTGLTVSSSGRIILGSLSMSLASS